MKVMKEREECYSDPNKTMILGAFTGKITDTAIKAISINARSNIKSKTNNFQLQQTEVSLRES